MMRTITILATLLRTTTPLQCPHGRRIMTRRRWSPNDIMTATEWGRLMTDASAGLVGGSMGVMGTLAVYENNRFHAKQRSICAYCEGTGFIKGGVIPSFNRRVAPQGRRRLHQLRGYWFEYPRDARPEGY